MPTHLQVFLERLHHDPVTRYGLVKFVTLSEKPWMIMIQWCNNFSVWIIFNTSLGRTYSCSFWKMLLSASFASNKFPEQRHSALKRRRSRLWATQILYSSVCLHNPKVSRKKNSINFNKRLFLIEWLLINDSFCFSSLFVSFFQTCGLSGVNISHLL